MLSHKRPKVVRSGFRDFDLVNGGFLPGSLVVLAATTGGGKSAMSVQLALNMVKTGHNVCIVPLEMSTKEVLSRAVSNISDITVGKYLYPPLNDNKPPLTKKEIQRTKDRWGAFEKLLVSLKSSLRIYEPEADLTMDELLTVLQPHNDTVVIVDYISLLRGVDGDDSWRQLGNAARLAKIWARNNKRVVILIAQLSEQGAIKYSRTIKEHADNMWSWIYTEENKETGILEITQQKARNQREFNFQLGHDFSVMKLFDLDVSPVNDEQPFTGKEGKGVKEKKGKKKVWSSAN